ncbi:hypothetical protein EST38_g4179 [Candolleomyces aberdarensis]|uniref:ATP-dependent DNA helicase PIF1 n=1 Tax=Candolleomyces aberdarensis TaxID=2316362 RepID=A0A4Q2DRZ9_9AGAR|nr:hypothetical protein EST38_g4179 [Candolleomyces aberdarensis]
MLPRHLKSLAVRSALRNRAVLSQRTTAFPPPFRIAVPQATAGFHSSSRRFEAPKSPFQTFVDVLKDELRKDRELQENVKQLQGDVDKLQDAEALKKARIAYERARLASSIKENPRLRAAAEELKKTGVKVGDAVSEALRTMEESEVMRAIGRASAALSATIEKSTEPIRNTAALKHAGFEEREARRLRRQKRLAKAGLTRGSRVTADPEAGQALVLHKDSPRQEAWNKLKETNPVLKKFTELRQSYDDSEHPVVASVRSVTDTIGSWFDENETAQVTRLMMSMDPTFNRESFERELREYIVPEVVDAYLSADQESLKAWCGEATYNVLWATMEQYLRQGLISDSKVLDIRQVDVLEAKILENEVPVFIITFSTQEMLLFRNAKTTEIVVGAEDKVEQCTYVAVVTRIPEELDNELTAGWKIVEDIPWSPTQKPQETTRVLTGAEKRLRDIQKALEECQHNKPPAPLVDSKRVPNKRHSDEGASDASNATKKRRVLPWAETDSLSSKSGFGNDSIAGGSRGSQNTRTVNSTPTPSSSAVPSSGKPEKLAAVFLSQEQTQILKLVQEGNSVFYTGSAGTGKSVLLREIIKVLRKKFVKTPDAIAITASTGIAACNIGGVTIHSFAGIGLGIESAEDLATKIRKNKKAAARWLRTRVLIIDEVSMVDGDLFDKLAKIGSILRKSSVAFGGIQVIITGDFFQLPPVTRSGSVKFAFEAELWSESIKYMFNLTKVFRQRDQRFIDMLNEMRFGNLSQQSIQEFRKLSRPIHYEDGMEATELFPLREDVERSNTSRMSRLSTEEKRFTAVDGGSMLDPNQRQKTLANFMAPQVLKLRTNAQVMLIKNVDDTLVNGSMGKIVSFVDPTDYAKEALEAATGVVGGGSGSAAGAKKPSTGAFKLYPLVEFRIPNGGTRKVLVLPEVFKVELPSGEVQVSRTQLPLILSWAMSIHKSQGQTLDRVKVDLGKVFEKGQAYVALSRATTLEGLQVLNFNPAKVQVHYKVVEWSKTLATITESNQD